MKKLLVRAKLCVLVPFIWPYCLLQCCLGIPQDMSIVKDEIKDAWRDAGK